MGVIGLDVLLINPSLILGWQIFGYTVGGRNDFITCLLRLLYAILFVWFLLGLGDVEEALS